MLTISLRWNILYMCEVCLCLFVSVLGNKQTCGDSLFYNKATKTCTPCTDRSLCERGTPIECANTCAFLKGCQVHHYFDISTGACTRCAILCHQAEARGTERDCRHLCPVDSDHTTVPQSAVRLQTDHPPTTLDRNTVDKAEFHPRSVVVVLLAVCVIVTVILPVVFLVISKRKQWTKCYQRDPYSLSPQTEEEVSPDNGKQVLCASVDIESCLSHPDAPDIQLSSHTGQGIIQDNGTKSERLCPRVHMQIR